MTEPLPDQPLNRRFLLRGGAVLAGAAGATVLGAALAPPAASAADGGPTLLGNANAANSTTGITIDGTTGGSDPALRLTNVNGPSLALQPVGAEWDGELRVGELVNTPFGPLLGVDYGGGAEVSYLTTGVDLDTVPVPVPLPPERVLDTRSVAGRAAIVRRSSSAALDSKNRLKAGAWIDVAVFDLLPGLQIGAAFLNLTAVTPLKGGALTLYLPDSARPSATTLHYSAGQIVSSGAFAALVEVSGSYAVRIHTSQTTHVLLALTGAVLSTDPAMAVPDRAPVARALQRRKDRQTKIAERLRQSLRSAR